MIELNRIYNEDCLEGMKRIPDGSVDMILCDLPYGTTACKQKPSKYAAMTDDELAEIAKRKNRRGIATAETLRAQWELYERHHWEEVDRRDENEGDTDDEN